VSDGRHQAAWVRTFNPFLSDPRWPARAGIYEPLIIYNTMKGEYVPWLATGYGWSDGNRRLTFTLRAGVRWSDGRPFTARDVAFTFDLMRRHPGLDFRAVWQFLKEVRAVGDDRVEFVLVRPHSPSLVYVGHQPIVPEHVWRDVRDPVTYRDENPVATGPFTVIRTFQNQVYELGRNESYWQPGKPQVAALRLPAYTGNDQATLALLRGELDWTGLFIPEISRVFVAKDPAHHHYWFPPVGNSVLLYLNTTRPPFDDARARKALSLAIDREQIVRVAMHGYTRPADATGLSDAYPAWKDAALAGAGDWVRRDVAAANRILDSLGFRRDGGGVRVGPAGPMRYDALVVAGWSDWVATLQIVSRNLAEIGVEVTVKPHDYTAWYERMTRGRFDMGMGWAREGPTPYFYYRGQMSSETAKPVGEVAFENWQRFASPEADRVLRQFEATTDLAEQGKLARELQRTFVETAPSLPLFPGPSWGEFNTKRFTGFPDQAHAYAKLAPSQDDPEPLLVLTEIRPRSSAAP
jgi:peptide/nickel transport system substrate-binding protein